MKPASVLLIVFFTLLGYLFGGVDGAVVGATAGIAPVLVVHLYPGRSEGPFFIGLVLSLTIVVAYNLGAFTGLAGAQ